jgi:hypothetical protein
MPNALQGKPHYWPKANFCAKPAGFLTLLHTDYASRHKIALIFHEAIATQQAIRQGLKTGSDSRAGQGRPIPIP